MDANNRPAKDQQTSRLGGGTVSGCCGGPAPVGTDACCAKDAAMSPS